MVADEGLLDRITSHASNVIGSWWMIVLQTLVVATWFCLNLIPSSPTGRFDNQHFDTLRLLLALQSVYTAPLILMAQRRVGAKDRQVLLEIDRAERQAAEGRLRALERRDRLEEKIDRLLSQHKDA
jgi:uncharacterized membrane protein